MIIPTIKFFAFSVFLSVLIGHTAHANKLDPKWAAMRAEANVLGDQAKAGDAEAYSKLESMSIIKGYAPYKHNVAWIYQYGYGGPYSSIYSDESTGFKTKQSLKIACQLYEAAAAEKYPPSMYAYAYLCLLPKAISPDDPEDAKIMRQARSRLAESAILGWVNSATLLASLTVQNNPSLGYFAENKLNEAINAGLASTPSKSEKVSLSFFKAVIITRSIQADDIYYSKQYKEVDIALQFAIKHGHEQAQQLLTTIREDWFNKLKDDANYWYSNMSLDKCVTNIKSVKADKPLAKSCKYSFIIHRRMLDHINDGAQYLGPFLLGENKVKLQEALDGLTVESASFQAERRTWEDIVVKGYNERTKAKNWGN